MFNKKYKEQIVELQRQVDRLIKEKSELEEKNIGLTNTILQLKEKYSEFIEYDNIKLNISKANEELDNINEQIKDSKIELDSINSEIVTADNRRNIQTMGLYDLTMPKYSTEEYKQKITESRKKCSSMLIKKEYYTVNTTWTYNGSISLGDKLLDFFVKQSITAFNLSVDAILDRITLSNIENIKERVTKMFNNINKELNKHEISLNYSYLTLVLQELDYKYELEIKKQQDKEEREYQKMLIKEQELAEKEITKQHEQLLKEREKYTQQLAKGKDVQNKIDEINESIKNNEYKKEHTLAGYVYIINNPSLGKDIYKIGVTRRLKWEDRITELNNASVPFKFTPNCILFSENAFALETALHRDFDRYRVNKINKHKEYFNVALEEIEKVVKKI